MSAKTIITEPEVWRADAHLSDLALTLVVDGEEALLPRSARHHLAGCTQCGARLGETAALAAATAAALAPVADDAVVAALATEPMPSSAPRFAFPRSALLVALALAGLGSAPAVVSLVREAPSVVTAWASNLPFVVSTSLRVLRGVLERLGPALPFAPLASAIALVLLGIVLVRLLPARRGEMA